MSDTRTQVEATDACGTSAGYQRHRTKREPACAECRSAWNETMKNRRAKPGEREKLRRWSTTRNRALQALAARHPDEFDKLLIEERLKEPRP